MPTTADELLTAAREQLHRSARSLPPKRSGTHRTTAGKEAASSVLAAWPRLAAAQAYTLECAVARGGHEAALQERVGRVVEQLGKISELDLTDVASAVPDPDMLRAADLTRAAGDALQATAPPPGFGQDITGTVDSVLSAVEASSRLTGIYAETVQNMPPAQRPAGVRVARPWLELAQLAHDSRASLDPRERTSPAGSVPVVSTTDTGVVAGLDRWRQAVERAVQPSTTPSADLPLVAHGLWLVHAAAHEAGLPGTGAAADAWRNAGIHGWGTSIRVPGPHDPDLRAATYALADTLHEHGPSMRAGQGPHFQALTAFIGHQGEAISAQYEDQVRAVVASEQAVTAARPLAAQTQRPLSPELASAAQRGRWVPLPAGSVPAQELVGYTSTAVRASTEAGLITRTREMQQHSFPTGRTARPNPSPTLSTGAAARPWVQQQPDQGRDLP